MTNTERVRQHIANDSSCMICGVAVEDISHVLRDCMAVRGVWLQLVKTDMVADFFGSSINDWILENLSDTQRFAPCQGDWDLLFGSVLWLAWKRRNAAVFGVASDSQEFLLQQAQRHCREMLLASVRQEQAVASPLVSRAAVKWWRPPSDWIKLNVDGARNTSKGFASCGGLGRDSNGHWRFSFSKKIGTCSVFEAELWAVYEGLSTTWTLGVTKVIVETDNREVYNSLLLREPSRIASSLRCHLAEILSRN
ncbi:hypothetical protein like AT5G42905 [Hibiscus trionum]|uniref:RNase H type-1 domain-containing protein n=1 Tax=Hibiscus trionum TaxID=183268 RepID=A0A9W7J596_HIBTR|nr:hypothetical protein like AT5G42905 [Hibiscus trionum]